jgi:hypothetical protein
MEYVGGESLKKMLKKGKTLPVKRAVEITLDICHAIAEMAQHDIVHRDIKPANILLTPDGAAKLTDFGVAQVGDASHRSKPGSRSHPGTPRYMSPEQENSGGYLDQRSDLYSLGLVLYEMLTGQNYKSIRKPVRQLNSKVPRALERVLQKVLQQDPAQRYQTAVEFEQALRKSVQPWAWRALFISREVLIGLGAAVAVILTIAGLIMLRGCSSGYSTPGAVIQAPLNLPGNMALPATAVLRDAPTQPAASNFKYPDQLEIATWNGERFWKDQNVVLEWKLPGKTARLRGGNGFRGVKTNVSNIRSQAMSIS